MYIYPSLAWYLAIYTSKYFTNPPVQNSWLFFYSGKTGRPDRSTGACIQDVHACACLSADRPVDRLKAVCSRVFSADRIGRPPSENCVSFLRTVDRAVDPSPTASCQQGGRPTGPVDRQACKAPTALSSLVQSEICFCDLFLADFFWVFGDLFQIK